ncbi:alginate export family protein [Roseibacterium sp. KMU-115]|uniref:Alginate export family protein n=2 Tax=Roseicyclus persicicus TaxID=2650661 RepID=A0A7X6GVR8_9RHOB|nr:alginate export family protein [Roseibacterium persicicum]
MRTAGARRPGRRRMAALAAAALVGPTLATAQGADPFLLHEDNSTTVRATLQFGANLVSEGNLFWNLADFAAPGSGFDSDATWLEIYVKPGLSFETALDNGAAIYGRLSAVASYTFGTDAFDVSDTGRLTLEESYAGVRLPLGDGPVLDVSLGARELRLGTGMLISDGASDGFERGALKFGPRRAWEMAAIAELTAGDTTGTLFYIDPRELPGSDNGNALAGLDLRYDDPAGGYLGLTYVNVLESRAPYPQVVGGAPNIIPGAREGTNTLNLYARTNPFAGALEGLYLTTDLAYQWNDRIDLTSWAGRVQVGYTFADAPWSPTISYGYQTFSGDDPDTPELERFDPLYYDGSPSAWATGSKSAMVFINSNVQSHNLALSLQPTQRDTFTFRYAHVRANELGSPLQFGQATRPGGAGADLVTGVTDAHLSDDFFIEYRRIINRNTFLTAGISVAVPGEGIRSAFPGEDPNWVGGFVNVVFNF